MRRLLAVVAASVLALASALTAIPPTAAEAHSSVRYAGSDRFATSVEISKWSPWTSSTVFLASGTSFPDALAAAPVAAAERARLLLTGRDSVPASVMAELRRIRPTEVVLVGGTSTISDSVLYQVYGELGTTITRIGGTDRVHTSLLLLDRLRQSGSISEVWVVSGSRFPDALVAGSIAGRNRAGIILDHHGSTASDIESWRLRVMPYFQGLAVNIAGGESAVSEHDAQVIRSSGAAGVFRYAGANRYETARILHDTYSTGNVDSTMVLASGENFPDALSGAAYAAIRRVPLYLAPSRCNDQVASMLRAERDQRGVQTIIGLGSSASLSDAALNLESCPPPPPPPVIAEPAPRGPDPMLGSAVNCTDFRDRAQAQRWFVYWSMNGFPGDPWGLDADGDGQACETLP